MSSFATSTQPQDRRAYECVDVGFEIHDACWHETIKQVPTTTTLATLNSRFENYTGSVMVQFYFDAGKNKPRHLYYRGLKWEGDTTLEELLAPGQTKITFNFVWEDKDHLIDVKFLIYNSNWTQTVRDVPKETTVGALNLHFGPLTGTLVPEFGENCRDKARMVYYEGYKLNPDTRLKDLCLGEWQRSIELHFVWFGGEEQTLLDTDQDNIDEFFREQDRREFQEASEEFLHDLDLYYEDQLYTAQDHAERKPSTMTYAMAAQKAAIERHYKMASRRSSGADGPWDLDHAGGSLTTTTVPACCSSLLDVTPPPPEYTPAFSMCIPRVFPNISERRIRAIFCNLGYPEIEEIDFVKCKGRNKRTGQSEIYNRVFIHFESMEISSQSTTIHMSISKILNGEQVKIMYDEPWYWMVSLSRSTRPAKRPAPPRIVVGHGWAQAGYAHQWFNDPREKILW